MNKYVSNHFYSKNKVININTIVSRYNYFIRILVSKVLTNKNTKNYIKIISNTTILKIYKVNYTYLEVKIKAINAILFRYNYLIIVNTLKVTSNKETKEYI